MNDAYKLSCSWQRLMVVLSLDPFFFSYSSAVCILYTLLTVIANLFRLRQNTHTHTYTGLSQSSSSIQLLMSKAALWRLYKNILKWSEIVTGFKWNNQCKSDVSHAWIRFVVSFLSHSISVFWSFFTLFLFLRVEVHIALHCITRLFLIRSHPLCVLFIWVHDLVNYHAIVIWI